MISPRSCPPPKPPSAPAMVLPAVPRLMFFMPDPAALPPMIPAMIWIMMLMMVADTGILLALGNLRAAGSAGAAAHRPYTDALYLYLLTIRGVHCATLTPTGRVPHALALVPASPSPGIPLGQPLPSVQQFLRHFPAVVGQLLHDLFVEPEIHRG